MERVTRAVTFDFGQTLAELDTAMLARRLGERGLTVGAAALEGRVAEAWAVYNRAILAGAGGHPWKVLMRVILEGAGVPDAAVAPAVDWLWDEQPRANLWRRPIAGMVELARSLSARGVPVGVVSNSEGRLAELAAELGWAATFPVVADSGRLGVEKPDPAIFRWAAARLGVTPESVVHVGDSYAADVLGARAAGMRAVWFRPVTAAASLPDDVIVCHDADEVRAALSRWGLA